MDIDILLELYKESKKICDNFYKLIREYKDGYSYIVAIRVYRSVNYEIHTNLHSLQDLCNDFNGDNGILDIYTNNNDIDINNYSGSVTTLPIEVINELLKTNDDYSKSTIIQNYFDKLEQEV